MKTFQLDLHHVVLYGVIGAVSLGAIGVLHSWHEERAIDAARAAAEKQALEQIDKDRQARADQFVAQMKFFDSMRVTPKTPAPVVKQHLQQLEPELQLAPLPLGNSNPDALPPGTLILTPADQGILVNRLVVCKECELERDKLKADLAGADAAAKIQQNTIDDLKKGPPLKKKIKDRLKAFAIDVVVIEGLRILAGRP